jgi:hypothetical protein
MLQDNLFTGTFDPEIKDNFNLNDLCLGNNGFAITCENFYDFEDGLVDQQPYIVTVLM